MFTYPCAMVMFFCRTARMTEGRSFLEEVADSFLGLVHSCMSFSCLPTPVKSIYLSKGKL